MRVLLFTGKGGVGKTSVAAATALRCADLGQRTIVLSTDPAHSLADAFDLPLGDQPTEITGGLWGEQLDAQQRMEASWEEIRTWLREVFDWAGVEGVEAEELAVLPGLDEVFSLADIRRFVDDAAWDTVVVDCAPTAETLRLLSLPDVLSRYMERVFPMGRRVSRLVSPVLRHLSTLPVADDGVFDAGQRFYLQLEGVKEMLTDSARSSIRLVVNPERMVIAEARRTYTYLSLFGYAVDAVIANRLLPDEVADPWFDRWRRVQAEHLETIESGFAPLPVLRARLAGDEIIGLERLRDLAGEVYGSTDPSSLLHEGEPLAIERVDGGYELILDLPFACRHDLELGRRRDELLLRVGQHRRALLLPDSLRRREVASASLLEGRLRVRFEDVTPGEHTGVVGADDDSGERGPRHR